MEHTNKIAIDILKEEYSDYPENDWHYNRQYRMLVEAQSRIQKKDIIQCDSCDRNITNISKICMRCASTSLGD